MFDLLCSHDFMLNLITVTGIRPRLFLHHELHGGSFQLYGETHLLAQVYSFQATLTQEFVKKFWRLKVLGQRCEILLCI